MRRKTKHLCNYCFMPGQEKAILKTGKTLEQFVAGLGLAGIELLVYRNVPYFESFEHLAVGVHLNYWPMWLAMYRNDKEVLSRFFTSKDALKDYYGTTYCMGWLRNIRDISRRRWSKIRNIWCGMWPKVLLKRSLLLSLSTAIWMS